MPALKLANSTGEEPRVAIVIALREHDRDDDQERDGIEAQDVQRRETYGRDRRARRVERNHRRFELECRVVNLRSIGLQDGECHRVPRPAAVDGIPQGIGRDERLTIDGADAIACAQACALCRTLRDDLRNRHLATTVRRLIGRPDRGGRKAVAVVVDESRAVRRHREHEDRRERLEQLSRNPHALSLLRILTHDG